MALPNRYERQPTPEEELESDMLFEEMLEMSEEECDRLADIECARTVEAINRLTPQQHYRMFRRSALGRCISARNLCRTWYADGRPVEPDHFLAGMLRSAQLRLAQLRASRASGYAPSGLQ